MATVLDRILTDVRADLERRRAEVPETLMRERVISALEDSTTLAAPAPVLRPRESLHVIAEVKRRSPSAGALAPIADPAALAQRYAHAGASVVSVLTERDHFGGELADLRAVRDRVQVPVLRKDFIVDPYQVWESKAYGADLILLIVAALSSAQLQELQALAREIGLQCLVEVHDEQEAAVALSAGADLIGVNTRNLKTLEVDRATFARVRRELPTGADAPVAVAESGVRGLDDVREYATAGAAAVLVGQALVTAPDPEQAVRDFTAVPTRTTQEESR